MTKTIMASKATVSSFEYNRYVLPMESKTSDPGTFIPVPSIVSAELEKHNKSDSVHALKVASEYSKYTIALNAHFMMFTYVNALNGHTTSFSSMRIPLKRKPPNHKFM